MRNRHAPPLQDCGAVFCFRITRDQQHEVAEIGVVVGRKPEWRGFCQNVVAVVYIESVRELITGARSDGGVQVHDAGLDVECLRLLTHA